LDYTDRIDGAHTPLGRPAVSPSGDEDMRYMWTDDALPVTPAYLKNQLKYEKRAQVVYVTVLQWHISSLSIYQYLWGYRGGSPTAVQAWQPCPLWELSPSHPILL